MMAAVLAGISFEFLKFKKFSFPVTFGADFESAVAQHEKLMQQVFLFSRI